MEQFVRECFKWGQIVWQFIYENGNFFLKMEILSIADINTGKQEIIFKFIKNIENGVYLL